jgi:NTP pyrophosphatase (non-canonical NTP hydrolase)
MLQINDFAKEVGENAVEHGWWEQERSFGELIALCHSELSEALEEYRHGKKASETYYSCCSVKNNEECNELCCYCKYGKPEGIPSELADVIIRVCDMCNHYGIDLEAILREKHEYNQSRPYKHGGKVI